MFKGIHSFRNIKDNLFSRNHTNTSGKRRIPAIRGIVSLALAAVLTAPAAAGAASIYTPVQTVKAKLMIGQSTLKLEEGQYLFIVNGRMYVPLRAASYALQKSVSWNAASKTVTVAEATYKQSRKMITTAGYSAAANGTIQAVKVKSSFIVNGKTKSLPAGQSAYIVNGTLYVPIRFVSELTGASLTWNNAARTIVILPTVVSGGSGSESGLSGGSSNKPSYESITGAAEAKLTELRSSCQQKLTALGLRYVSESDAGKKAGIAAEGKAQLTACSAEFEKIVANTEQQLVQYGYSTSVIGEYRAEYESELKEGQQILSELRS